MVCSSSGTDLEESSAANLCDCFGALFPRHENTLSERGTVWAREIGRGPIRASQSANRAGFLFAFDSADEKYTPRHPEHGRTCKPTIIAEIKEITDLPRGAKFIRADLHIHSTAAWTSTALFSIRAQTSIRWLVRRECTVSCRGDAGSRQVGCKRAAETIRGWNSICRRRCRCRPVSIVHPPWPEAARHRMRRPARPCAPPTAVRRAK